MKIATAVLLVLMSATPLLSQWQSVGDVNSVTHVPGGIELRTSGATVRVTALSPSVVRVRYAKGDSLPKRDSFAVVENTGFTAPSTNPKESADAIEFSTGKLIVRVEKASARVVFLSPDNKVMLQDHPNYPVVWNGSEFRVYKSMPADEHYFGLGDKAGPLDHRDSAFTMWNMDAFGWQQGTDPVYKSIPFFIGMRGGAAYGVFLDNTWRSSFDFGKQSRDYLSFGSDGGDLDYYFFYGPDPKQVISDYTALTGRMPLPPLFALGFQQSRYSYYPESRVRRIASELRKRKIPADVIYLDIHYLDRFTPFTLNKEYFPDFAKMVGDLAQQNLKVVTIVDLHLANRKGYRPFEEGAAGDHFLKDPDGSTYVAPVWPGPSVFPDFTREATRRWFGTLYRELVGMGVRGIWNDMNEPAIFETPTKTMPLDTVHRVDVSGGGERKTSHREIHNVVGHENVHATYDGLLKLQPDSRPFVLTRAAFAGSQRYAATWTGDNQATWSHYGMTLPTLLSLGLSGYTFVGNDVGGFDGSPTADLLTRWMQVGAFTPLFRNHTAFGTRDQEPWVHGPEHEAIRRRFIEARYRLLPYIYTLFEESSRTGTPVMRPLFLEFPKEQDVATIGTQFMFGPGLLVAPKLTEMLDPYPIVLPKGDWYDYWTGLRVEHPASPARTPGGGTRLTAEPSLGEMPVFVRAGAIIPHQPLVQSTEETPNGPLELRVYPGSNCNGTVYADDGKSFEYRKGQFFRQRFTCDLTPKSIQVDMSAPTGSFVPWWKQVALTIYGTQGAPKEVKLGTRLLSDWKYDPASKSLSVTVPVSREKMELTVGY
ncbi:MAG TPA: glycoside hydrolase family 31 protein [Terriglobales bacterium]|nr:glycoside hydrolase family 31 protein [Terriglobales bacterium]